MPISCHFRDCKAFLITSLIHVRSTIASTLLYLIYFSMITCGPQWRSQDLDVGGRALEMGVRRVSLP